MRATVPGLSRASGDGDAFEMGGNTYRADPASAVRVKDPIDSYLGAASKEERPEVLLRQALRACVAAGVPDSRIVDIVNLELVNEVMWL